MSAIGSLVFCTDCGNLLPPTKGNEKNLLQCECCGQWNKGLRPPMQMSVAELTSDDTDTGAKLVVTKSKPSDFPSALRQKLQSSVQQVDRNNVQTETSVRETCKSCGREEVKYTTVQLRGADEGSTIIYNCECGNS